MSSAAGFEGQHRQADKQCPVPSTVAKNGNIATMRKGFPRTKLWALGIRLLHLWNWLWVFPSLAQECRFLIQEKPLWFWFDFCSSTRSSCGHSICWFLCLLMSSWCVSESLRLFVTDKKNQKKKPTTNYYPSHGGHYGIFPRRFSIGELLSSLIMQQTDVPLVKSTKLLKTWLPPRIYYALSFLRLIS